MFMRNVCWRALVLVLTFTGLAGVAMRSEAQTAQVLIEWTNTWKYNQSGMNLGTGWKEVGYNDAAWPSGRGLLGFEPDTPDVYTVHAPINTALTVTTPSITVTTYYFRTTFQFSGGTLGLSLVASNLVDDGCVLFLNGTNVGNVRAVAPFTATTFYGGPAAEGQLDVVPITNLLPLKTGG